MPKSNLQKLQKEAERLYRRLRKDAEALVSRGRKEIQSEVRALQHRADRMRRDLETSLLRRVNAASETELRRLERRVAVLERRVEGRKRAEAEAADRGAA